MKYRLMEIRVERTVRGDDARRLIFRAQPSDAFGGKDAEADGLISHVVTTDYAARFEVGAEYFVSFRHDED